MNESMDDLLKWAEQMAHDAGDIMREYFELADKQVETKGDQTPVTIADKKINDMLIERVAKDFPSHGVRGEEASRHADRKNLWVCDPIDGTIGFIFGLPVAMFSLAYVVDGQPLVAAMYEPLLDKMFSAVRGKGAWQNSRPIKVSSKSSLRGASVGLSSSLKKLLKDQTFNESLLASGASPVISHGAAFRGGLVATGRLDATVFPGRGAHDIAAVKLIVEEAGGKVTDLDGNEQRYDQPIRGAVISNGKFHDELLELVTQFGSEQYLGY